MALRLILVLTSALSIPVGSVWADTTAQHRAAANYAFPTSPLSTGAAATKPSSSSFTQADDGLFYVEAQVNGHPVKFVVDSGASVVVLTKGDAARVGARSSATGASQIETAGGASNMRWTRLHRVTIAGQTVDDVDAAVVDSELPVSLMGQSLLSRLQSVTFRGSSLQLN